ncbi:DUF5343 domain-containing protein [Solidesulfovibrio sp. C21]|uniref:DUF5343 domain-containing protein n=1 Tax=Solidesulfovibrio sp. C21 TaxID=3398613 RepID=UPI0039FC32FA
MTLPNAYSLKTGSIPKYFQALLALPVPDIFNAAFFADIGFRYAIDRSFIDILKELHFLDTNGRPTRRYFDFHDGIAASATLLDGIREAYGRLLETDPDACAQPQKQIFETLKTLYAGNKPDMMILGIAKTFVALCQYAEEIDRNPPPLHAAMEVQSRDAGQSEPGATPGPAAPGVPRDQSETTVPVDATEAPILLARPEPAGPIEQADTVAPRDAGSDASEPEAPTMPQRKPDAPRQPQQVDTAASERMPETPTPQPEPAPAPQNPTLTAVPADTGGLAGDIQESDVLPPLVLDEDAPPLKQATGAVQDAEIPEGGMAPGPAPEPAAQAAFSPETPPASEHVLEDLPEASPREPDPVPVSAKWLSIRGTSDVDGQPRTVNFVLPETRDPAVYEAIFASFKRQLLKPE